MGKLIGWCIFFFFAFETKSLTLIMTMSMKGGK